MVCFVGFWKFVNEKNVEEVDRGVSVMGKRSFRVLGVWKSRVLIEMCLVKVLFMNFFRREKILLGIVLEVIRVIF